MLGVFENDVMYSSSGKDAQQDEDAGKLNSLQYMLCFDFVLRADTPEAVG